MKLFFKHTLATEHGNFSKYKLFFQKKWKEIIAKKIVVTLV